MTTTHAPLRLRELPVTERPTYRLCTSGAGALSDAEILSIVLGGDSLGLAQRLLLTFDGWKGLQQAAMEELCQIEGIGSTKAAQIKAALEVGRRQLLPAGPRPHITCPADVANLLMAEMAHLPQEHFRVINLSTKNHILKISTITIGTIDSASVRAAEVYRDAIKLGAAALILIHQHPSGDPTPSADDVLCTRNLIQAGQLLGIECIDHIVIGQGRWISMRERRLGWS